MSRTGCVNLSQKSSNRMCRVVRRSPLPSVSDIITTWRIYMFSYLRVLGHHRTLLISLVVYSACNEDSPEGRRLFIGMIDVKGEAKFDIVLYCVAKFTDAIAAAASCFLSLLVLSHKMIRIVKSTAWKVVHRKTSRPPILLISTTLRLPNFAG